MKFLAQVALKGPAQATALTVALALLGVMLPPLAILGAAIVGLICLQADAARALMVLLACSVLASVLGLLLVGMPLLGVAMALLLWLPVAAVAMWLRRSGSLSQAMLMSTLLGLSMLFVLQASVADFDAGWNSVLDELFVDPTALGVGAGDSEALQERLSSLGVLLPGLLGMSFMLTVQLALLVGRWMQSQVLKAGAFGAEYRQIHFGQWPMLLVAAAMAAAFSLQTPLWQSVALLVIWLPVTQGIALMHAFCGRPNFAQGKPLLVLAWVLFLVLPHFVALIAALGAVESWFNWRRRWVTAETEAP